MPYVHSLLSPRARVPSLLGERQFLGVMVMLLFVSIRLPAQFLKPAILARAKDFHQTRNADKSESRDRFVSLVLFFCMLAAGLYDEILRYAF
jgi:hypothetical protein